MNRTTCTCGLLIAAIVILALFCVWTYYSLMQKQIELTKAALSQCQNPIATLSEMPELKRIAK